LGLRGRKYYVQRDEHKTWFQARGDCESLGGFLVTANTRNDLRAALAVMPDLNGAYWLGGSDLETEGVFIWHSGERQTIDNMMWNDNQPDNFRKKDHCLISKLVKLSDVPCKDKYIFMCEIVLYTHQ